MSLTMTAYLSTNAQYIYVVMLNNLCNCIACEYIRGCVVHLGTSSVPFLSSRCNSDVANEEHGIDISTCKGNPLSARKELSYEIQLCCIPVALHCSMNIISYWLLTWRYYNSALTFRRYNCLIWLNNLSRIPFPQITVIQLCSSVTVKQQDGLIMLCSIQCRYHIGWW